MAHADFVHLRFRSAYSLLEGAIKPEQLVKLCCDESMPAVAMSDHGNLFGALEFAEKAVSAGLQPIIGCLLGVCETQVTGVSRGRPDLLLLLAQNETGYINLLDLVSRSFLEGEGGDSPHVDFATLEACSEGLIALSGGPQGPVGRLISGGQIKAAESCLTRLAAIFQDRFYIEIMRHGLAEETQTEPVFLEFADRLSLPLVATNDIYFADAPMYEAHDVLLCIAEGVGIDDPNRRHLTEEHRFKSCSQMRALFADLPEAYENSLTIARRCSFFPEERSPLLPCFSSDRDEASLLAEQAREGLGRRLAQSVEGLASPDEDFRESTDKKTNPYHERLDYELKIITEMGYAGYFLIVADFIAWGREKLIPVGPGRGSGAGSVVAWALGITDLDPLRFGLLFERFLNPERVSMPDFDIDFCVERRDEVIHYVREKYGRDYVAQIITFGTLQARAALRDVGRVLNLPYGQVDRVCKLVPFHPAAPLTLAEAIASEPALSQARDEDPDVARMMDIALQLEGLPRHASTHAAGVVIGDRPLKTLTPLYRDLRSDIFVTQFSMKYVEKAGLVKFDFLGLKTLTLLEKASVLVREQSPTFTLDSIPLDDPATYALLATGETVGIFQLESTGMRDVLRRLKPDRFEDIIAVVALYRPGPMDNIPSFIARKHGREKAVGLDSRVDSVLAETYGIMIYQEQVMQIAQILAGYSLGAADLLRRAMGKKIQSEMDAQRTNFVDGAEQRGMPKGKAEEVFDQIAKFAGYGFNKSHAAAYAMIAYQTAYMKANYPVEFLAASMTCDLHNTDKLAAFRREARRLGIGVLPPDVNSSRAEFSVETVTPQTGTPQTGIPKSGAGKGQAGAGDGSADRAGNQARAIRYGLAGVRHVGEQAMRDLVDMRCAGGVFGSLGDFASRLDTKIINKRLLESLVAAGGLDSLHPDRGGVFASIGEMVRLSATGSRDRERGQETLFSGSDEELPVLEIAPDAGQSWDQAQSLQKEYEALGFYLSAHPLDSYAIHLENSGVVAAAGLEELLQKQGGEAKIRLAGVVLTRRVRSSQKGNRYAFLELSDQSGSFEVIVFSEALARADSLLVPGSLLWLAARARIEGERVRISVDKATDLLTILAKQPAPKLRLYWPDSDNREISATLNRLKDVMTTHAMNTQGHSANQATSEDRANGQPQDIAVDGFPAKGARLRMMLPHSCPVRGKVMIEMVLPGRYRMGSEFLARLGDIFGKENVVWE